MTLDQQLRGYVDDSATPVTIEEILSADGSDSGATAGSDGRGSRRALVAAVVLIGVGIGAALITLNQGDSESVTTSAPTDDTPSQPVEVRRQIDPESAWEPVSDPDGVFQASDLVETDGNRTGTSDIRVNSVVELPSGFFAVGRDVIGFRGLGAIWRSDDGESWERVSVTGDLFGSLDHNVGDFWPSGIEFHGIAEKQGVIVVAGIDTRTGGTPVAFRSVDGANWEATPIEAPSETFTSIHAVVATPEAFVIVGLDNVPSFDSFKGITMVWRSLDGRTWEQVSDLEIPAGTFPAAATVVADRIVMVGSTGGLEDEAAAWTSDDGGLTWVSATVPASGSELPFSAMSDVASGPDGLLAVGDRRSQGNVTIEGDADGLRVIGEQDLVVWRSDDGSSWTEQAVVDLPGSLEYNSSLVSGSAGFLVTTASITPTGPTIRVWITSNGSDLTALQAPETGSIEASIATGENYYLFATETSPFDNPGQFGPPASSSLDLWKLPTN